MDKMKNMELSIEINQVEYTNVNKNNKVQDIIFTAILLISVCSVFLLVFVFPLNKSSFVVEILSYVFLGLFFGAFVTNIVFVMLGLINRGTKFLNNNIYTSCNMEEEEYLLSVILEYQMAIKHNQKLKTFKQRCLVGCFISISALYLFFFAAIILKLIVS